MDIHSPLAILSYGATTLGLLCAVQWLLLPEVGLPDMEDPLHLMTFERLVHGCGAFCFGNTALHYYRHKPKTFRTHHYGMFLIACTLQHVVQQFMHEVGYGGSTVDMLRQSQIMATYGNAVVAGYCLTHGGPVNLFRKLANQPTLVFMAMVTAMIETLVSCASGWHTGTYPALMGGLEFFLRVACYFVMVAILGFLVVQYVLYQQSVAAVKKKIQ